MKKRGLLRSTTAMMAAIMSGMLMMYLTAFMVIGLLMMGI
jgi:hypothetical protein